MSLLANLPASGLLAQMTDKAVRPSSPRRHIQTSEAGEGHTHVLRTDTTNILIRYGVASSFEHHPARWRGASPLAGCEGRVCWSSCPVCERVTSPKNRSLQQKRRRQTAGGGASHTEVASSANWSGDKGKKRFELCLPEFDAQSLAGLHKLWSCSSRTRKMFK